MPGGSSSTPARRRSATCCTKSPVSICWPTTKRRTRWNGAPAVRAPGRSRRWWPVVHSGVVTLAHDEIFRKYLHAGAISRDPEAVAALFAEDGVYEAPLMPDGLRLAGRAAIREGIGAVQQDP